MKRGWSGPNICVLCKDEAENAKHLFVDCSFSREIWSELARRNIILAISNSFMSLFPRTNRGSIAQARLVHLATTAVCWGVAGKK